MKDRLRVEPVALAAAVRAVLLCAVAFGLSWTPEQIAAFMVALEAVLAVVVRNRVWASDPSVQPPAH